MPSSSAPTGGGWDTGSTSKTVCSQCGLWTDSIHDCRGTWDWTSHPQMTIDYFPNLIRIADALDLIRIADALERIAKALEDKR